MPKIQVRIAVVARPDGQYNSCGYKLERRGRLVEVKDEDLFQICNDPFLPTTSGKKYLLFAELNVPDNNGPESVAASVVPVQS